MPLHIKDRSCCKLTCNESHIEVAGSLNLCDKVVRNNLTCLVMTGVCLENLRLECPVLVDLGWKLHEIALDVGAAGALVGTLLEKAVEGVAQLVEHSLHLIKGKK